MIRKDKKMNKNKFDRVQSIGRNLREIFNRDKAPFSAGCEDYLVRAVEEAQSIEKDSDLFHGAIEMIKPKNPLNAVDSDLPPKCQRCIAGETPLHDCCLKRPLKVDDVYDDSPSSVFCEECTNIVNRRDAEKVFDEILMKIVWKCKECLYS